MKTVSSFAQKIVGQSMFRILAEAKELERQGKKVIHFEIGDSYLEMPDDVKKAAVEALYLGRTHYGASHGEHNLREAICAYFEEDYGFRPDLAQTVVTSGANPLIYYTIAVLVNPDEEVIITDPSFVSYKAVLSMLGIKAIRIHTSHHDGFRMAPEAVEKSITSKTKLIVINSPCNPTGAVYSENDIRALYRIAEKHDLYVLSDEIYATIIYEGKHFSPGVLDACRERVIVTNGFSKPFAMTGWRVGYAVGPEPVIEKIGLLSQTIVSCVPPFLQDGCVAALKNRKEYTHIYTETYRKLRDIVCRELGKADALSFTKPAGAFYIMIDVSKTGMDGDEFSKKLLEEEGVVVCPGSGFGSAGKNYIRICYAKEEEKLTAGLRRITAACG